MQCRHSGPIGQSIQSPRSTRPPRVAVVGAGVGGLAAALHLAASGAEVCVLEAADAPGGKLQPVRLGEHLLDAGPTVLTMRWVFDELAALAGQSLEDATGLTRLPVLARHHWPDGSRFDLPADPAAALDAIGDFAGAAEAHRYRAFCERIRGVHDTLLHSFMAAQRPTPWSLAWRVARQGPHGLARIAPFHSLWHELGRHFHDPRLRQLFGRYATYCGGSPQLAPATLMVVAHVEQQGVWSLPGGLYRLAQVLVGWLRARAVPLRCGCAVRALHWRGARVAGVVLAGGEVVAADHVVFNGDVSALPAGLLGDGARGAAAPVAAHARSLSALTWTAVVPRQAADLLRHNVYFAHDGPREFQQLFGERRLPADPTIYLCAQDREAATGTAAPHDRLLCLVNAPALGHGGQGQPDAAALRACERQVQQRLADAGLAIALGGPREGLLRRGPAEFAARYPGSGGALYGRAPHGWRSSFARAAARSAVPGLSLAGGSVHPGPGLPMAALSGRLAAQRACEALGLPMAPA
ncbi:1-hydroxycarotenoid 3,4-desaturase CrtD [Hydrogenophaga sp. T2]|uniref:1-hydroxycarotenoid 3,4-desaturase CrtD n=1 Tax=Hydrogenophaga sp. T2 TaxID=3132823 RepID=UPI003CEE6787